MHEKFKPVLLTLTLLMTGCSDLHFKDQHTPLSAQHQPTLINPEIHALLQQEMQAIQKGMMSLIPAIASGDWEKVAEIGNSIEGSYLLKQKLTAEQRQALHQSLPAEFIKQDQTFHQSAGMLAHAAEKGNADIVSFYLYKLTRACVECHSEFASEKFPLLDAKQSDHHY